MAPRGSFGRAEAGKRKAGLSVRQPRSLCETGLWSGSFDCRRYGLCRFPQLEGYGELQV